MVINETLRLFPPAPRTDRNCSENYEYNGMKIEGKSTINIAIYALHHDADLYPEPEKFDPERFNQENKNKRANEAFIP